MSTTIGSIFCGTRPGEYTARRLIASSRRHVAIAAPERLPRETPVPHDRTPAVARSTANEHIPADTSSSALQVEAATDAPPCVMATDRGIDARLIAILEAPADPAASTQVAFARKERELAEVLATLVGAAALAMQHRLLGGSPADELAVKFGRLTGERRARLLHYLADAPRRAASATTRNR